MDATNEYQTAMALTDGWTGDAATKYRGLAQSYIDALGQIAKQAQDAASGVQVAGVVVATTRAIIFDLIATSPVVLSFTVFFVPFLSCKKPVHQ